MKNNVDEPGSSEKQVAGQIEILFSVLNSPKEGTEEKRDKSINAIKGTIRIFITEYRRVLGVDNQKISEWEKALNKCSSPNVNQSEGFSNTH